MLMVAGMAMGQQSIGDITPSNFQITVNNDALPPRIEYWNGNEWAEGSIMSSKIDSTITYEFEGDWLVLVIKTEWGKTSKDGSETTSSTDIIRKKVFKLPYKRTPEFWGHVLTTDGSGVTWGKPFGTIQNLNNQ